MAITNLQMLLAALSQGGELPSLPQPARPVIPLPPGPLADPGRLPGPMLDAEPTPPPQAPMGPPVDMAAIDSTLGPRPQAPRPPSTLQRIANMLMGFSAGVEGRGGQFLESLREPQRQYEAQTERFNERRAGLIESAEDRRERQRERVQQRADMQSKRDFELYLQKQNFMDDAAKERTRQVFQMELEAKRAVAEQVEEARKEREQKEREARHISDQYFSITKNKGLSDEIGKYRAGLKDSLSPAAVKLYNQVTELGANDMRRGLSRGVGGGRGSGASKAAIRAVENFEARKAEVESAVARQDIRAERLARRKLDAAVGNLARFPGQIEYGGGEWPWAKLITPQGNIGLVGGQPQAAQQPQGPADAEVQAYAQRFGIPIEQARRELGR